LQAEGVDIAGVVDLHLEAAAGQVLKYGLDCKPSTSLGRTLGRTRPDFVVDLTVPEAHCAVTCRALRAGCHVIGEKPMAASMREARRMVRASEETGKLYMVSQSRRWDSRHETLRRTVASGEIGAVTTINCDFYLGAHFGGFRDEMASPLILDMAIHHFDLARFFTGLDPVAVYAKEFNPRGSWYRGDVAASCIFEMTPGLVMIPSPVVGCRGVGTVDARHPPQAVGCRVVGGGAPRPGAARRPLPTREGVGGRPTADEVIFTYRGSWCAEGCDTSWNGDWRIVGDRGTLLYDHDQDPVGQVVAGDEGFNRPLRDAAITPAEVPADGMHGALREMLTFLRTGERPQTECHDNLKSLSMVLAAIDSSRKGKRVEVQG
jgi:predicted dehydrogenase